MKKIDLLYRNTGTASATKIQQTAFAISRSNAKDAGPWNVPKMMSEEGSALAKNSQPRNAFEVPYLDDPRKKFSVSDREVEAWRKFQPGDMTEWEDPAGETDPDYKLFCTNERDESKRFDPNRKPQIDAEEEFDENLLDEKELLDQESEEEIAEENRQLARTGGAFDKARLYRAIDRLAQRTKKHFTKGRDHGRSYGRDNRSGRSYSACSGFLGGVAAWNEAYRCGEVV